MPPSNSGAEQFGAQDRLRTELEGKIQKVDEKCDGKTSTASFHWAIGIFISVCVAGIIIFMNLYLNVSDKIEKLQNRLTVIETVLKQNPSLRFPSN
jgi:hypothetical protein